MVRVAAILLSGFVLIAVAALTYPAILPTQDVPSDVETATPQPAVNNSAASSEGSGTNETVVPKHEQMNYSNNSSQPVVNETVPSENDEVFTPWRFRDDRWQVEGTAPDCPDPLTLSMPVDRTEVTSILWPGQVRSQYKPHGGFRFDGSDGDIAVTMPIDAFVTQGSRYIEGGTVQYLFDFQHPCGIKIRFDHLRTISPALRELAETLPEPQKDDTRTTRVEPRQFERGTVIATAVGTPDNMFVDLGVYDLRSENDVANDPDFTGDDYSVPQANYAVCWLEWLPETDEAALRGLGASNGNDESDYCDTS